MENKTTLREFEAAFEGLMDRALNELSPAQFEQFKDSVSMILSDSCPIMRIDRGRYLDMWPVDKEESLLDKGVFWVYKNLGPEYVEEFCDKYKKMQMGLPIGNFFETAFFVELIETIKREG